ncbi:hypothetical protein Clacol_002722 [Clathrus columnatus]|uniref:NADH:flavin oxidoreductase/NADH oxidase N-terminal domain-containing protein n=1 Tax=Clathrus columnatus TaxID=1419009 RepID=A0AAV5A1K3_9AGAM|nr:hypothetical protein Clacol_002722 [Clathrus columnatus]
MVSSPSTTTEDRLFEPLKLGTITLQHRIALAPLTRCRAALSHVHNATLAKEYYAQRGSEPGTLLITEATFISKGAGGYKNIPGIWSEEQCRAWKTVTTAVHKNKSFIFCQLWALGRAARPVVLDEEDHQPYIAPSSTRLPGRPETPLPRALTVPEIKTYVRDYAQAAKNAIVSSGFDGVEVHAANGYLIDQFTQSMTNLRDDDYGGDVPRRAKFLLEVMNAVCEAVGEEKVGIRLSPWNNFQGMGMEDPIPQFSYIIEQLKVAFPRLAYVHIVEPDPGKGLERQSDILRELWAPRPFLSCNEHEPKTARQAALRSENEVVVFGRHFISNPDLPNRIRKRLPLTPYNHDTFYTTESPVGYIDYPFIQDFIIGKVWISSVMIGLPLFLSWAAGQKILVASYSSKVFTLSFDPSTTPPSLTLLSALEVGHHPSWIVPHPIDKTVIFTATEEANGIVKALKYDLETGIGSILSETSSGGADPCHLAILDNELLVANYSSGIMSVFPLTSNSPYLPSTFTQLVQFSGTGPILSRQEASHPHQVLIHPERPEVLIPDLGADKVWRLQKDNKEQQQWVITDELATSPGGGPRHGVIIGENLYLLMELSNEVTAYKFPALPSEPSLIGIVPTMSNPPANPLEMDPPPLSAEILSPPISAEFPKKYLYVTNRNDRDVRGDILSIFEITESGIPRLVNEIRTELNHLRGIWIDEDYKYLISGSAFGDEVKIFERKNGGVDLDEIVSLKGVQNPTHFHWLPQSE